MISPGYRSSMARRNAADVAAPPAHPRDPRGRSRGSSGPRSHWPAGWSAQGVIEVLEPLTREQRRERIVAVAERRLKSVTVVLDAPHDPHNGAAVMRSCDAFGIQQLHVVPGDEPFQVSHAVAKGTERWVDVIVHESPERAARALRQGGFELIATHPSGTLTPSDLGSIERLALVLGNEHAGIRPALTSAATGTVRIPMRGFVESLNVSVSAAILLWAATDGRPSGDLTPEEKQDFYAIGLLQSVPRARDILAASRAR